MDDNEGEMKMNKQHKSKQHVKSKGSREGSSAIHNKNDMLACEKLQGVFCKSQAKREAGKQALQRKRTGKQRWERVTMVPFIRNSPLQV